ncbi:MAG: FkbM family methyltransferase [Sphingomicrobium sp.]
MVRDVVAKLVSTKAGLRLVNEAYDRAGDSGKCRLYWVFANIFKEREGRVYPGDWRVKVPGGELKVEFGTGETWLDWVLALSLLGHDQDVKQTYAAILASRARPAQFIDVGANYGCHSLLLARGGVPTLSFEPNPDCIAYFRRWATANGIQANIEPVALGDSNGEVHIDFPPKETWLGMVSDKEDLPEGYRRITVPVRRLDDYIDKLAPGPLLIKLDAEGSEPAIIRGAERIIAELQPNIIFECWNNADAREAMLEACAGRFAIYSLPWRPGSDSVPIDAPTFVRDPETNYIAVPV